MSFTLEIIALVVCLAFIWRYLGSYMAAVFEGRVHWMGWLERPTYRLLGVDPEAEQTWQRYAVSLIIYSGIAVLVVYGFERLQGSLPAQPAALRRRRPGAQPQHRDVVRDEHELAELHRRVDDVLPHPDGRPRRPAVRQRGGRHGGHDRHDPRLLAQELADDRQLLGRRHPRHLLHPASDRGGRGGDLHRPGRRPDPGGTGAHPRRAEQRQPDDPPRSAGLDDAHQAAREQRRRLHERQRRPPVREPDRLHPVALAAAAAVDPASRAPTCTARWSRASARASPSSPRCWCCSAPGPPSRSTPSRGATRPSPRPG